MTSTMERTTERVNMMKRTMERTTGTVSIMKSTWDQTVLMGRTKED